MRVLQPGEEWVGQKPCKWTSNRKHTLPPSYCKEGIKEKIFSETYAEPPANFGKKTFPEKVSPTMEYRPCLRIIRPKPSPLEKVSGMKKIVENYVIVKPKVERVHFQGSLRKNGMSVEQVARIEAAAEEKRAVANLINWYILSCTL
eukprot:TRINITY_DN799_c0_g5_i1.p1 TRINITY_DN799_c0_g5~~TRINITY_DN799_c0_g5_i1.p1  ORF type:complete len:146 (-),score=22.58 TRINITY_DN799_c0_g5_i1:143-580(-)